MLHLELETTVDHFRANLFKAHFLSLLIHKVTPRA